jgi:hypothetical protein
MLFFNPGERLPPKHFNLIILAFIFFTSIYLSSIIPPFQSPDEIDHIKRAYLLTKGVIVLETQEGHSSGGQINEGLMEYFSANQVTGDKSTSPQTMDRSVIMWKQTSVYGPAPGTGF